ncbi:hypothetical protein FRC07_012672, partial [Ceratobasidium sp. 392]
PDIDSVPALPATKAKKSNLPKEPATTEDLASIPALDKPEHVQLASSTPKKSARVKKPSCRNPLLEVVNSFL